MNADTDISFVALKYKKYVERCLEGNKVPMKATEWIKKYSTVIRKNDIVVSLYIDERIYRRFLTLIGKIYKKKGYAATVIEYLMEKKLEEIEKSGVRSEIITKKCLELIGENCNEKGKMYKTSFKVNKILVEKAINLLGNKEICSFIRGLVISYVCDEKLREEVFKATTADTECLLI